jgi:radical SAM protein with 4Fe4S-binding SPASM domain
MIDINFYMATHQFKKLVMQGWKPEDAFDVLEHNRSKTPVVFNIETTNSCTMTCVFCPRTKLMTRPIKTMKPKVFERIANQLEPHSEQLWRKWQRFAYDMYGVPFEEQSENAFFLYVIPRVIVLHGYGDPLLDPHIADYVGLLTGRNIPSYFSCNPSNINMDKIERVFDAGLSYIKFSVDNLTSSVRGQDAFCTDYPNIMRALEKAKNTQVIITMIDMGQDQFAELKESFRDTGVYIYQKSLDQSWLTGKEKPKSIHWQEPCSFPWSSLSVNSSGLVIPCGETFNNDIILGDTTKNTLQEIWNGDEYRLLRANHIYMTDQTHCTNGTCEMNTYGKFPK